MRTLVSMLALVALATVSVAQGGRPDRGAMMRRMGPSMAMQTADADGNHKVTADEWAAFTSSITTDGKIALATVQTAIVGKAIDANGNGKLEQADLVKAFKALDKDADGALSTEEMSPRRGFARRRRGGEGEGGERPRRRRGGEGEGGGQGGGDGERPRRGDGSGQGRGRGRDHMRGNRGSMVGRVAGRAVLDAADTDRSRSVSAEEWKTFLAKFPADETTGAIDAGAVTAELLKERKAPEGKGGEGDDMRRAMRRRFSLRAMLGQETFDADQDGKLAQADFDKMFTDLDENADKVVTAEEMRPQRFGRGRRGGRDDGKDV